MYFYGSKRITPHERSKNQNKHLGHYKMSLKKSKYSVCAQFLFY